MKNYKTKKPSGRLTVAQNEVEGFVVQLFRDTGSVSYRIIDQDGLEVDFPTKEDLDAFPTSIFVAAQRFSSAYCDEHGLSPMPGG